MSIKVCPECKEEKNLERDFWRDRRKKDGRQLYCKPCISARNETNRQRRIREAALATEKLCPSCKETKPAAEFYKNRGTVTGLTVYCKVCWGHKQRQEKYGLSPQAYEAMVADQEGRCACCGREESLVVDHCHTSGAVRALLCGHCNRGIGHFFDNPDLMRQAIMYLEAHASTNLREAA